MSESPRYTCCEEPTLAQESLNKPAAGGAAPTTNCDGLNDRHGCDHGIVQQGRNLKHRLGRGSSSLFGNVRKILDVAVNGERAQYMFLTYLGDERNVALTLGDKDHWSVGRELANTTSRTNILT